MGSRQFRLHEPDNNIYWFQNVPSSPRSDPLRVLKVFGLALENFDRYQLSRQQDDLDQSLLHFTEAIFLPLPWSPLLIVIFYSFTLAIFSRANAYRQHRDVKCCIAYIRYLRRQGPFPVTEMLISALAVQARLNLGDVDKDIEEMADLCGELLNSQTIIPTGHTIADFALAVAGHIQDLFGGRVPSEKVLGCLRKAIIRFPDLHEVSFALAKSLLVRFNSSTSDDDYKEGMAMLDNVIDFRGWGDRASPYQEMALSCAALFAKVHFDAFGKPEHLEISPPSLCPSSIATNHLVFDVLNLFCACWFINRNHILSLVVFAQKADDGNDISWVEFTPQAHSHLVHQAITLAPTLYPLALLKQVMFTFLLEVVNDRGHMGLALFVKTSAPRRRHASLAGPGPSEAIYRLRTALDRISPEDQSRPSMMANLSYLQGLRFDSSSATASAREVDSGDDKSWKHFDALGLTFTKRLTDMADIEDAVQYCRELINSHPHSPLAPVALVSLSNLFGHAFEYTNQIGYLNEAISAARGCMNIAPSQSIRLASLLSLISRLSTRLELLHSREDLDELMQAFAQITTLDPVRLSFSFVWASIARRFGHPSALTAYDRGVSSMEATLTFSPTLDTQYLRLAARFGHLTALPFDYTSYLIHTGRLKQAIEALERGRALLWSEMRGLRTPVDQIRQADSNLADKFAAANRDLETLTLAFSPISNADGGDSGVYGLDPFGHLVVQQQKLLDDRKKLISQIQALPDFDTFLNPPSFDTLCSASSHGPVIVINHSRWRSDIVILLRDSPPSLISTSDDFYARTKRLQDQLLGERKKGLESVKYEDALRYVLKELYELVGRPVIKRLNQLNVPEQSRVWWCPTSVFCSLPLHAMGPIPSDGNSPRYFMDLYIPSYIPSLEALIESRKPSSQVISKPSILLIAQPDENMPEALKEMRVVQAADADVTRLFSAKATPAAVLARLRDHSFAHIVSHGILEPGKPFEASFKLHRGRRLQLLDIVRSQLPDAEFAFLSACHTAELTDESIADEMLHLAAAMQFCGFRSVVGTMWAMADTDGPDLAKYFYESVFSDETRGERHYERTAVALRDAVVKLRRKGGISLERWVNFVHYGA